MLPLDAVGGRRPAEPRRRLISRWLPIRSPSIRLPSIVLPTSRWPAPWALVVLLAAMEGARAPLAAGMGVADATLRLTALLPLLLLRVGHRAGAVVWGLVGVLAWLGGALSAGSPASGPAAVAARPWTPSRWAEVPGVLAGRVLADPRVRGDRWSAPVAGTT